jgi:hypothetical protein
MPKLITSLADYAPVADRIALFYQKHSLGQILTDLVSRQDGEITFRARVYRTPDDRRPCATGWASEFVGDGEVNEVACLENTETSAVGRALANLGFTASRLRPSNEEMMKVARTRARAAGSVGDAYQSVSVAPRVVSEKHSAESNMQLRADMAADAMQLVAALERLGVPAEELLEARETLSSIKTPMSTIERVERSLRRSLEHLRSSQSRDEPDQ